jgi:predicted aconitase with swiveling domain
MPEVSAAVWTATGRALLAGAAAGSALVLDEPLSFWGGLDPGTGKIVDQRHPQVGAAISGRVLVMPSGRGSSSSSSVLAESLRAGTGPAAVLLREPDEIVLVGAMVVQLLDGMTMPVVVLEPESYDSLTTGIHASVGEDGHVTLGSIASRRDAESEPSLA